MRENRLLNVLKWVILGLLDIITLTLFTNIWTIFNLKILPLAIVAILIPLALLHLIALRSDEFLERFGVASYATLGITTFGYYLAILIYTGITYLFTSRITYIIMTSGIALVYFGIVYVSVLAGSKHIKQLEDQQFEAHETRELKTVLLNIKGQLRSMDDTSDWVASYEKLSERVEASTPFGRIQNTTILEQEDLIFDKLTRISNASKYKETMDYSEAMDEVTQLVKTREKLIVK